VASLIGTSGGRLRLVRGAELPAEGGWFGKQWALVQGHFAAQGELLLFADADTVQEPELVPRAIAMLQAERAALVSVLPRQEMESFWERLIQPQVFVALWTRVGDLRNLNRTRTVWNAIANGQFILTTRAEYERVGTHAAVKHTVADDVALAQAYVAAGRDIFLAHAEEFMRTRMYRTLAEIIEGWSKNLALGAPLMLPPVPLLRALLPYVMWLPALVWIAPPIAWVLTGWPFALVATLVSLAIWVWIHRMMGAPPGYALLYPFGAAMVAFIMMRSAWRGGRRVEWRGRTYRGSGNDTVADSRSKRG
jgi:chlorobactene glucosyltransferase